MKTISNINDFRATKQKALTVDFFNQMGISLEELESKYIMVYAGQFFISLLDNGTFHLTCNNDEFITRTIEEAEEWLWDEFAKYELGVDIEQDINDRIQQFIEEQGFPQKSLDELLAENGDGKRDGQFMTLEQEIEARYLLDVWNNI